MAQQMEIGDPKKKPEKYRLSGVLIRDVRTLHYASQLVHSFFCLNF